MDSRTLPFAIKSITEAGVIEGVISAFGGVDSYGDTVASGAYSRTLSEIATSGRKLPMLYQHDPARPIGVWTDLRETQNALVGKAELALEVRDAQEAHALAKKGALTGISIGYTVAEGGSRKDGNTRVLTDLDLWEASLVTFPADRSARVTGVKRITAIGSARDIAELLQEAGVSGRKAKLAAGAAWKAINENSDDEAALAELAALVRASTARLKEI